MRRTKSSTSAHPVSTSSGRAIAAGRDKRQDPVSWLLHLFDQQSRPPFHALQERLGIDPHPQNAGEQRISTTELARRQSGSFSFSGFVSGL